MLTTITARHFNLNDEIRNRAEQVLEKAAARTHRPHRGEIVLDRDHGAFTAEIRFHTVHGNRFTCMGEADDPRSALDLAAQKLHNHFDKEPLKKPARGEKLRA